MLKLCLNLRDRRLYVNDNPGNFGCAFIFSVISILLMLSCILQNVNAKMELKEPLWTYQLSDAVVSISSDGSYLVGGNWDTRTMYVFDRHGNLLWKYKTETLVEAVDISSDSNYITMSDWDNVYLFQRTSNVPLWNISINCATSLSITSHGDYILANTEFTGESFLLNKDGNIVWNISIGNHILGSIDDVGHFMILSNGTKTILMEREYDTPRIIYNLKGNISTMEISKNGKYIVFGTYDGTIYLFNNNDDVPIWSYCVDGTINDITISDNGTDIAVGLEIKKTAPQVWESKAWSEWYAHPYYNRILLFSNKNNVSLWSYDVDNEVRHISISGDGERFIATTVDRIFSFQHDSKIPAWASNVEDPYSLRISKDGDYVIVGDSNRIYLFENIIKHPVLTQIQKGILFSVSIIIAVCIGVLLIRLIKKIKGDVK